MSQARKNLSIRWQTKDTASVEASGRLIAEAAEHLRLGLARLGISVEAEQADAPRNAAGLCVEIDGRTLEEWLGAQVDPHTGRLSFDGETYQDVSADDVIEAGLLAAAWLLDAEGCAGRCPRTGEARTGCGACCGRSSREETDATPGR